MGAKPAFAALCFVVLQVSAVLALAFVILITNACMPFCEAIDMRPLVLALDVSLTHFDLSGHRLDIASNRRAFADKLPMMQSLVFERGMS